MPSIDGTTAQEGRQGGLHRWLTLEKDSKVAEGHAHVDLLERRKVTDVQPQPGTGILFNKCVET
jgi:hypothetical protein